MVMMPFNHVQGPGDFAKSTAKGPHFAARIGDGKSCRGQGGANRAARQKRRQIVPRGRGAPHLRQECA
ncbi:MAG: hypothetical protein MZW92_52380 [Comamonadaceae bacterium]|nr:hypothetical protein [Comamonadaceae bacterium]